jgi:4-hydroxybenzoate polyprenyltransferase
LKDKIHAYFQLIRLPNFFTAAADILAGYLIVRGLRIRWPELLLLCLSTCFIYGGGCILNDIRDKARDGQERPHRPIASGRVSRVNASWLTIVFFSMGLLMAFLVGMHSLIMASILVLLAVLYDLFTKKMAILGPVTMAACRSANLLLGMSPVFHAAVSIFIFPLISFGYVFALTTLSRFEVSGGLGGKRWIVSAFLLGVILVMFILWMNQYVLSDGLFFLAVLVVVTGPPLIAGFIRPEAHRIGKAVKYLILGIPLLDAAYVSGLYGWTYGIVVGLCMIPAVALSWCFHVT